MESFFLFFSFRGLLEIDCFLDIAITVFMYTLHSLVASLREERDRCCYNVFEAFFENKGKT